MSERSFLDRAWDAQHAVEKKMGSIGKGRYARVLRMARKPDPEQFRRTSGIVLVGIGIIGLIGFIVLLLMEFLLELVGAV